MRMNSDSLKTRNLTYGRVPVTEIPKAPDYTENPDDVDDIDSYDDDDNDYDDEGNKENRIVCGLSIYSASKHARVESKPPPMNSIYSSHPPPARVRTVSSVLKESRAKESVDCSGNSGDYRVSSVIQALEPSIGISSTSLKPNPSRNFLASDPIVEKREDAGTQLKTALNSQLPHPSSGCRAIRIPKSTSKEPLDKVETFAEDVCDDDDDEDDVKDDDDDDDDDEEEVKDDDNLLGMSQRMHEAEAGGFAASGAGFGYGNHLYNQHGPLYNSTYPMSSQKRESNFHAPSLTSSYASSSASQKRRADNNASGTGSFTNSSKFSDLFAPLEELSAYQTKTRRFGDGRFSEVVDSIKKSKKQEIERMNSCRKSMGFSDYGNDSQRSLHLEKSASATDLGRHLHFPAAALPRHGDAQKSFPNSEVDGVLSDGSQNRRQDSAKTGGTGRMQRLALDSSYGTDTYKRMMSNNFLSSRSDLSLKSKMSDPSEPGGRTRKCELSGSADGFHGWRSSQVSDLEPDQKSWRPIDWNYLETNVPVSDRPSGVSGFDADSPFMNLKTLKVNSNVYLIQKIIGKGGSSKVYKAISPNCETCAIKCVSFENAEESTVSGYRNEIKMLQQLQNSEKIVKLYDYMFDRSANMLYVVMESGDMDLHAFFRTNGSNAQFKQMLIRPFWIEMLHAVQVLHKQGIVHSDLKLANFILVCGQVKLIDFGIAKTVLPDCTSIMCDEIVGTFNYMSPEAITDLNGGMGLDGNYKPNVKMSTKSDVWSLGCILYSLVYLRTPFEHIRNQFMKLQAIINPNHEIEFPPTKMAHAVEVIKKCLDRNPKSRPSIEELLDHPFVMND